MTAPRAVYANHGAPPPPAASLVVRLGRLLASGRVRTLIAVAVIAPLIGAEVGMLLARPAARPPLTLRGPIGRLAPPPPFGRPVVLAETAVTDAPPAAAPFILPAARSEDRARATRCLADAVYYEAALEPAQGRRAVAQVVLNRVRDPNFPKSVCGVVYDGWTKPAGCQFTFACDGSLARPPRTDLYREAIDIAAQALSGRVEPSVGLATHYHATSVDPRWRADMVKVAQVGSQIFYRWPGAAGRSDAFTGRYAGREVVPPAAALLAPAAAAEPVPDAARKPPVLAVDQPIYLNGRRVRSRDEVLQMNQWLEEKRPTTAASS